MFMLKISTMILTNFIGLFNWNWGIIGAIIMFAVFLILIVAAVVFMRSSK